MIWYILALQCSLLNHLLRIARLSVDEKDLDIVILRQQLDVLQRKHHQVVRPNRQEKWTLAVLAVALKSNLA